MSDMQGESQRSVPTSYVFQFGTWRAVPVRTARQSSTQGRPPKKKGG